MTKKKNYIATSLGLCCLLHSLFIDIAQGAFLGFSYGTLLSNQPSAEQIVDLLTRQHIDNLRLYDANGSLLQALSGTGVEVMVTIPNSELLSLAQSSASVATWVKNNVIAYLPNTAITCICVGTEVLTSFPNASSVLVEVMTSVHSVLVAANLDSQVKVSTSHSSAGLIVDSFPPSQAFFNHTFDPVMLPLLQFLSQTASYFMISVYTYDLYKASNGVVLLDYALLDPLAESDQVVDSNTLLSYSNLFDSVVDSAVFAMAQLNYTNISVVVTETGWPSKGESESADPEATSDNASIYNSNLIRHIINNTGTPKRPGEAINTYILSLFNEDLKAGPTTTRNYGLFNSTDMQPLYLLRLAGVGLLLGNASSNQVYCVAKPGSDTEQLQIALDWACGSGGANCSAIQLGNPCYNPNTVQSHASFAFNMYFQLRGQANGSCDFGGIAIITTTDPSYEVCIYPGSLNITSNTSVVNATFSNTTTDGNGTSSSSSSSALSHAQLHIFFTLASLLLLSGIASRL